MAKWLVEELQKIKPQASSQFDQAVMTEYAFGPRTGFYHDMEYVQGKAWSADFFGNVLYSVDPKTKEVKAFPIINPEGTKGTLGAHTINKTRDGKLWITFLVTGQVARFDPATGQFTFYGGFNPHSHVHSFALATYGYMAEDEQGRIWITHFTEEYLSRLDPATGAIEQFALPHSKGFQPQQVHPYAVSMDRQGRLWYTKLQSNTLGVLDPKTRKVREFSMPRPWSGPRRLAIDTEGRLWIPEYTTNRLTVFDTKRMKFLDSYSLPSKGDYPYALRINEQTGEIWLTGTGTDSLYRFSPKTKQFRRYAFPNSVAYSRMVTFDEKGNAWTVYGSFPNTFGPYTSGVVVKVEPTDA
jgi:streptogramin lyase